MYRNCLLCGHSLPETDELAELPRGRRFAYDGVAGRLWILCEACGGWNLHPLEERMVGIEALDRRVRDRGRPLASTDHVTLFDAEGLTVVRIGGAGLEEEAWWRYGRELHRRRARWTSLGSRFTAYTFGALTWAADIAGLRDPDVKIVWDDAPLTDILRWRRFGWAAWYGREKCLHCGTTLRALRYDLSWWLHLLEEDGEVGVGVPCSRCDPWTPEKVHRITGPAGEEALRRVLAYQHISGATREEIRIAARQIDEAGSANALRMRVAGEGSSLWKMHPARRVALEIAVNESVERKLLEAEARALEFRWRREEELARIIDEELEPEGLLRRSLARLRSG